MINCIAIDDEPLALEVIGTFCEKNDSVNLKGSFSKASEALKYIRKFPVDLLLLDIQMPDISGIDLFKSLQKPPLVIFTTAYSNYAVEGFNLNAVDYLLKPIKYERFVDAIEKAAQMLPKQREADSFLTVRSEYRLVKIPYLEIEYIEGLEDYVKIHLVGKRTILTRMNLKNMADKLPDTSFIRVHRSFIVPVNRLSSIRNKRILLGSIEIPIGPLYEKDVMISFSKL
jgi:DNA-binding LytR/AlgR family response regulator